MPAPMRILITGGLGYVGGRIAQYLAQQTPFYLRLGTRKIISQNKIPTIYPWLKNGEICHLDLTDSQSCENALQEIDVVIHLAAVNEIESLENPKKAVLINTLGTRKLLEKAQKTAIHRFIYFSTAHVYGAPLAGIISETTDPKPVHPYAITHHDAEDMVLAATHLTGVVLRLSNAIGAPISMDIDRWTLLANDLCRQAILQKELHLKTPGTQYRDFITLTDVGQAVKLILTIPKDQLGNGLFNLGSGSSLSIFEMATLIAERYQVQFGFTPPIFRPQPNINIQSPKLVYSIAKICQLGFRPSNHIATEIDQLLKFISKEPKEI